MTRHALDDEPTQWLIELAPFGTVGQLLIRQTEFGMAAMWREQSHATWSPPQAIAELPRWAS